MGFNFICFLIAISIFIFTFLCIRYKCKPLRLWQMEWITDPFTRSACL